MTPKDSILVLTGNQKEQSKKDRYAHPMIDELILGLKTSLTSELRSIEAFGLLRNKNFTRANIENANFSQLFSEKYESDDLVPVISWIKRNLVNNDDEIITGTIHLTEKKEDHLEIMLVPLRLGSYFWGNLLLLATKNTLWTKQVKLLCTQFSKVLSQQFSVLHTLEKEAYAKNILNKQLSNREDQIKTLEEAIDKKAEVINKLKSNSDSAAFTWKKEGQQNDEVWLTVHGFKNGNPDPIVSKWEKVRDGETFEMIDNLLKGKKVLHKAG